MIRNYMFKNNSQTADRLSEPKLTDENKPDNPKRNTFTKSLSIDFQPSVGFVIQLLS